MADERIDVGIYATDHTAGAAGAAAKNLQKVETTVQSASKNMLTAANASKVMSFAMGGFAATSAFQLAQAVANGTVELAKINVVIARSRSAFTVLSGGAEQAKAKLEAVRRASMGTVNDLDAMQLANKAAALGMAKTAGELEKIVGVATKISMVMGGDVSSILDNLSAAAANLSFVRLDTMGISAGKTKAKMQELLETEKGLSQEQAFLQASVAVANETFKGMGEGALVARDGAKELETSWRNLTIAIASSQLGDAANAALSGLAEGISDITSGQAVIDSLKQAIKQNDLLIAGYEARLEAARDTAYMDQVQAGALAEVDAMSGQAAINAQAYADESANLVAQLENEISALERTNQALFNQIAAASGAKEMTVQTADEAWAAAAAWLTFAGAVDTANGALSRSGGKPRTPRDTRTREQRFADVVGPDIKTRQAKEGEFDAAYMKISSRMQQTALGFQRVGREANDLAGAMKGASSALEGAAEKIPGLFGTSQVTEADMAKAKAGLPVNYPDDYVRRAKDELINKVDYANIDPAEVAKSVGLDLSVGADVIVAELERQWASGEYFVNPENLLKVNWDAYRTLMQQQANAAFGGSNLLAEAMKQGITEDSWQAATTGTGPLLVDGVTESIKTADMNPAAEQFGIKMGSAFGDQTTTAGKAAAGAGEALAIAINAAYNNTAASLPWNVYIPGVGGDSGTNSANNGTPNTKPSKAVGTSYWAGGALKVHKDEMIVLPRGSQVRTAMESQQSVADGGNVTVNAVVNTPIDVEMLTQQIMRNLRRRAS